MNRSTYPDSLPQAQKLLEQRRQEALRVASKSDRLLRHKFGATHVVLFGSLAGQSPWHWSSDIDLAVAGLTFEQWLSAREAVRAIAPDWLSVDLVRLETLNPAVRRRVFQQGDMTQNKFLILKGHLEDEVQALEETTTAMIRALAQVPDIPEDFAIRTLASYINDFYRRCERMSERVAIALDGELLQRENWHQVLLQQVSEPGGENRPPFGVMNCYLTWMSTAVFPMLYIIDHIRFGTWSFSIGRNQGSGCGQGISMGRNCALTM